MVAFQRSGNSCTDTEPSIRPRSNSKRRNRVECVHVQPVPAVLGDAFPTGPQFHSPLSMSDDSSPSSESVYQAGPERARESRQASRASETDDRFEVPLRGVEVGSDTRCTHYDGPRDIIAIRFACCDVFYPCHACHKAAADHDAKRWSTDRFDTPAILCGQCRTVLTIGQYLEAEPACPACGAAFNPDCARHHDRYFRIE